MSLTSQYQVGDILWQPSAESIAHTNLCAFMAKIKKDWGYSAHDYASLYKFSVEEIGKFWSSAWDFCGVIGTKGSVLALEQGAGMTNARWFPNARLNFAENLLRVRDGRIVVSAWNESGHQGVLTGAQIYAQVSQVVQALRASGVGPGDRVVGYMPNIPETLIAMLGTTAIGAIWSVCSPELGAGAVIDRYGQIEPKVLFIVDGVVHSGKKHVSLEKGIEIAHGLPSLKRVVVVRNGKRVPSQSTTAGAINWEEWLAGYVPREIDFAPFPFAHPCYILYTSGTTGKPKCIVHSIGGTLLKHLVDQILQGDVRSGDRIFRVTSAGWVLWNCLASALACEARAVLYDGSPFHPKLDTLLDILEREQVTMWGLAPPILEEYAKAGLVPRETHDLSHLKFIAAGGMRLAPESYVYVYDNLKKDVHLTSPSGGTDVISFLVGGNPIGPCRMGQIQVRALGVHLEIFDEEGRSVIGEKGEAVVTRPFPSIPVGFWNDSDRSRFLGEYFSRFPGVWRHGDWAELTPGGSVIMYGRSDATLKTRGIRIGTAEIYVTLSSITEIVESAAVDQVIENDSRVVLFVELRCGVELNNELERRIKQTIAVRASPRHVPDVVIQVPDLPRTGTGKVSEIAIREAVRGKRVKNEQTLANPGALAFFYRFGERTV